MSYETVELKNWGIRVGKNEKLLVIAGLNVLEEASLAMETAEELKRIMKKINLPFIFKASFDKANRSSVHSYRGPGLEQGLFQLQQVKEKLNIPVITDIHEVSQAELVARVVDIVQIPAFLCRQTDLVVSAAHAVAKHNGLLHIKKAQFLAPWDCKNIIEKVRRIVPDRLITMLCERGSSFGYNNLVVDMLAIPEVQKLGVPVTIDATHSVQLPGAGRGAGGENTATGGRREGVEVIARAGVAAGANGVFLEFHPHPDQAKCDGSSCLALSEAERILTTLQKLHSCLAV